jgi:hypothetical protein
MHVGAKFGRFQFHGSHELAAKWTIIETNKFREQMAWGLAVQAVDSGFLVFS